MTGISIALSGGGHRATLFGLGVLLYLADAGKNTGARSISSVSGGSITNGFVAQEIDYSTCGAAEFEQKVAAPLAGQICLRGTLYAPLLSKLYLVVLVLSGLATVIVPWAFVPSGIWRTLAFVVALLWTAWIAAQRGNVCGAAYRKTLFSPHGRATRLTAVKRNVDHVICSTDLRTARQVYMSPSFLYGYSLGWAIPEGIPLHRAVLASACFPGGFPPVRVSTRSLSFRDTKTDEPRKNPPSRLVLVDGGVYDNMGDQWARGYAERVERWPALSGFQKEPHTLVVVNSSARRDWKPFKGSIPVWGEAAALLRDMNAMYENTTAVRRQDLVERFDHAAREEGDLSGALVMIRQTPFDVASYYAERGEDWPERARRAKEVLQALEGESRDTWEQLAQENSDVPTTLRALGIEWSTNLLRQAYVLAMANLHVILGYPLMPIPAASRFEALARGEQTAASR